VTAIPQGFRIAFAFPWSHVLHDWGVAALSLVNSFSQGVHVAFSAGIAGNAVASPGRRF